MGRKIFRSGNSTVVSIPPEVLELLGLEPGDEVNVVADAEHRRVIVTPTGARRPGGSLEVRERLGEFIARYGPALERLAEMEQWAREAGEWGIDGSALDRARALREAFAAQYGVLSVDLVEAVRAEGEARAERALSLRQEEGGEPGR
jgi:putative addiction module antidote